MSNLYNHATALALLQEHNKEPFHIQHGLTVEGVMRWYANELGYAEEVDFWATVGLLHDIDFEEHPDEHLSWTRKPLEDAGYPEEFVHAILSHGYGICSDVEPVHEMEKTLFTIDELTGLIWSASLMRPSKSTKDMEVKSLKKKFKDLKFAAGCSREIINQGIEMLGVEQNEVFEKTILAMRSCEDSVAEEMASLFPES